jgi:hypothetical protein
VRGRRDVEAFGEDFNFREGTEFRMGCWRWKAEDFGRGAAEGGVEGGELAGFVPVEGGEQAESLA